MRPPQPAREQLLLELRVGARSQDDRTITLTAVDPLQDAPGADDDVVVPIGELPTDAAVLIVRSGPRPGTASR